MQEGARASPVLPTQLNKVWNLHCIALRKDVLWVSHSKRSTITALTKDIDADRDSAIDGDVAL